MSDQIGHRTSAQFFDTFIRMGGNSELLDLSLSRRHIVYDYLRALRKERRQELIPEEQALCSDLFNKDRLFGTQDAYELLGFELGGMFPETRKLVRTVQDAISRQVGISELRCTTLVWIPRTTFAQVLERLPPGYCTIFDKKQHGSGLTHWMDTYMEAGFRLFCPPRNQTDGGDNHFYYAPTPQEVAYFILIYWLKRKKHKFTEYVRTQPEGTDAAPIDVNFFGWDADKDDSGGFVFKTDDAHAINLSCRCFLRH